MLKITRYPIAISLTLGLILVALLSILASLYSIWMTTVLSGDASAVNVSGSLRMQSYRIAFAISQDAPTTDRQALLAEFEQRLTSPQLKGHIPSTEPELNQLFSRIESHFLTMKDNALHQPTTYLNDVADFVADIDRLVASLEKWSEGKVKRLRQQQVVINGLTLFAASLFTLIIFFRVVSPLQALMRTVVNISQGDRSARANYDRADEFGELTTTFNQMADEIADVHNSLESTIHEQTQELSRNNQILEFLFNLSQALSIERPDIAQLKHRTIDDLSALCQPSDIYWTAKDTFTDEHQYVVKCTSDRTHLVCRYADNLPDWQIRILNTVGDMFDNANNRLGSQAKENRIALLNERSSIARELHDSLAQQLSYLKIQIVRWIKLRERKADDATLDTIVNELREGLNSSYRKLRELLVTFRAHSDEPGLIPSVKAAADEINRISQQTKVHLYIDEQWPQDLSPSQEIHCLHVIREALTNVIKHAQAENAVVSLKIRDDGDLEIKINDDGIGFDADLEKPMHYGLKIMRERAERIAGKIQYQRLSYGGAGVTLSFKPDYIKEEANP